MYKIGDIKITREEENKRKRPTEEQKEYLLDFFESKKYLAFERISEAQQMWDDLSTQLNALDGSYKSGPKWRKFWTDLKSYTKDRYDHIIATDNEHSNSKRIKPLSEIEKRILGLMLVKSSFEKETTTSTNIQSDEESSSNTEKFDPLENQQKENKFIAEQPELKRIKRENSRLRINKVTVKKKSKRSFLHKFSRMLLKFEKEKIEIERMKIEIEKEKLRIENRKLEIEKKKLELEAAKLM